MVTFDDAREIVRAALADTWNDGELVTSRYGMTDDAGYCVDYGRREWIDDAEFAHMPLELPLAFVAKADGALTFAVYLKAQARIRAMRPITGS